MVTESARRTGGKGTSWLVTFFGIALLSAGGFFVGLVVGVVFEEPELLVGHMVGRSNEIDWAGDLGATAPAPAPLGAPDVAAAGPSFGRPSADGPPDAAPRHAPVAPASSSSAALPEPLFAIQVGAFGDGDSAQSVATHLRRSGYAVRILEPSTDDRWRVRVGPVEGRDEADRVATRLKSEEQLPTWVLREQGT